MTTFNAKPKLLIVHDHSDLANVIRKMFEKVATCFVAPTLKVARELLATNPDLQAAIVDGQMLDDVGGTSILEHTLEFLRELKATDHGIALFAYSGRHNAELVSAGCHDHVNLDNMFTKVEPYLKVHAST